VLLVSSAAIAGDKRSSAADRKEVSITVYNQSFGLVREVRSIDLGTGRVSLELADVAATIQPETVAIKALGKAQDLGVLEQNYRYDLLTPATLLEKFVGQKIRVYRYNEQLGKEDGFDAKVLSVADGSPVLEIGGEITYHFPGRLAFPKVPDNLIAKPTLVWLLDSKAQKQEVEVTYLAQSLNWNADYVMVIDDADERGDVTGWVTLSNQSGASYLGAKLKLVAGDVNRVQPSYPGYALPMSAVAAADGKEQFREESLFEYHLYTLQRPTDVLQNEQKQVTLLEAKGVGLDKRLIFFGQQYWYRSEQGELQSNQKVGVYLDVVNSEKNGLGMPLPKGTVRVYKADKSGAKQFVGEDRIDHTPKDEKFRVKMGEAFDVVGDRKQTEWSAISDCVHESAWEIELRNHKDKPQVVEIVEPIGGDWTVINESMKHEKRDASTFVFKPTVPANGKTKVTYRVRVKWC
jgi:hypothetical protein